MFPLLAEDMITGWVKVYPYRGQSISAFVTTGTRLREEMRKDAKRQVTRKASQAKGLGIASFLLVDDVLQAQHLCPNVHLIDYTHLFLVACMSEYLTDLL